MIGGYVFMTRVLNWKGFIKSEDIKNNLKTTPEKDALWLKYIVELGHNNDMEIGRVVLSYRKAFYALDDKLSLSVAQRMYDIISSVYYKPEGVNDMFSVLGKDDVA